MRYPWQPRHHHTEPVIEILTKAYTYQRKEEEGKVCMEIEKANDVTHTGQQSSKCNNASYDEPQQRALKATHELQERLTTDLLCLNYINFSHLTFRDELFIWQKIDELSHNRHSFSETQVLCKENLHFQNNIPT